MSTLETSLKVEGDKTYIITGDINAMWLRDSSCQVNHYLKLMKDALQAVVDEQQNVVSTITEMLDRQREMYEEQQKAEEDVVQKQIDSLNEQLELLEKQNEERDLQLQKEQALYDLHNAQTQKKIQVKRIA